MELSNLLTLGFFLFAATGGILYSEMFNVWIPWNTVTNNRLMMLAYTIQSGYKGATDRIISHQMLSYEKSFNGIRLFQKIVGRLLLYYGWC